MLVNPVIHKPYMHLPGYLHRMVLNAFTRRDRWSSRCVTPSIEPSRTLTLGQRGSPPTIPKVALFQSLASRRPSALRRSRSHRRRRGGRPAQDVRVTGRAVVCELAASVGGVGAVGKVGRGDHASMGRPRETVRVFSTLSFIAFEGCTNN